MRFLIVGAGGLGGYFGARLLQGGADVEFLVRPERAAQLAKHGLIVTGLSEGDIRRPVKAVQACQITRPYDVILLTCKGFDTSGAMAAFASAVDTSSVILPLLNGVKHIEILSHCFGAASVLGGVTLEIATLMPNGEIARPSWAPTIGKTAIGELTGEQSDRCRWIQKAFVAGGMEASLSDTIVEDMWAKFAAFVSSAAVAAICRSRAGGIAAAPSGAALVSAAIDECNRVVTAAGYPMPAIIMGLIRNLYSQPGSNYGPSILADIEQGRRTEAEHTIGHMADLAAEYQVSTPILTAARCNLEIYETRRL